MSQNYQQSESDSYVTNQIRGNIHSKIQQKEEHLQSKFEMPEPVTYQKQKPITQYYDFTITPKPQKKIVLYGDNKKRYMFTLAKDRDVGIRSQYQDVVIESWNDDDKKTSTTQMERGMRQTLDDFYEILHQQKISQQQHYKLISQSNEKSPSNCSNSQI